MMKFTKMIPSDEVLKAQARDGDLEGVLKLLPRERWLEQMKCGCSRWARFGVYHYKNARAMALLVSRGAAIEICVARDGPVRVKSTIFHKADFDVLDAICAVAPHLRYTDSDGSTPLQMAIVHGNVTRGSILIKHGARFDNPKAPIELHAIQYGVLKCRSATVALLCVKRAGRLWRWDKFLLALIARQLWDTRMDEDWLADNQKQAKKQGMQYENTIHHERNKLRRAKELFRK